MAGSPVDRNLLDAKASEAVVSVRNAFRKVETLQTFLANNPIPDNGAGVDPLVDDFGYNTDEAYLLRLVFGDLYYLNDNINTIMRNGRKLTGLE